MCPGICRIIGGIEKTMWGRIKEIRKIITGWIKDNIFSAVLLVCIACIIILLLYKFTSIMFENKDTNKTLYLYLL